MGGEDQGFKGKLAKHWKAFGKKTEWMESTGGKVLILALAGGMILYSVVGALNKKQETERLNGNTEVQEQYRLQD